MRQFCRWHFILLLVLLVNFLRNVQLFCVVYTALFYLKVLISFTNCFVVCGAEKFQRIWPTPMQS